MCNYPSDKADEEPDGIAYRDLQVQLDQLKCDVLKQEHRLITAVYNAWRFRSDKLFRNASMWALIALVFSPMSLALGTTSLVAIAGLLLAGQANLLVEKQNEQVTKQSELLTDQNAEIRKQNDFFQTQIKTQQTQLDYERADARASLRTRLIESLYSHHPTAVESNTRDQMSQVANLSGARESHRIRQEALIEFVAIERRRFAEENSVNSIVDLSFSFLDHVDIEGIDLTKVDLTGADLRAADLRNANLRYTELSMTQLSGAFASDADFVGANLENANLTNAFLDGCDFTNANLRNVHATGAVMSGCKFEGADLSGMIIDKPPKFHVKTGSLKYVGELIESSGEWILLDISDEEPDSFIVRPSTS